MYDDDSVGGKTHDAALRRIRHLEDAAAHWEHKYSNARQYNRNLETRNQQLEAALREIADFAEQFIGDDEDGDERMYKVHQIADNAIPFVAETKVVEPRCQTCGRPIGDAYPECNNAFHAQAGNRT
jgi:hypothetical protein